MMRVSLSPLWVLWWHMVGGTSYTTCRGDVAVRSAACAWDKRSVSSITFCSLWAVTGTCLNTFRVRSAGCLFKRTQTRWKRHCRGISERQELELIVKLIQSVAQFSMELNYSVFVRVALVDGCWSTKGVGCPILTKTNPCSVRGTKTAKEHFRY